MWQPDPQPARFAPSPSLLEQALPTAFPFADGHPLPPLGSRGAHTGSITSAGEWALSPESWGPAVGGSEEQSQPWLHGPRLWVA